jgi:hypothetical protein
MSSAPRLLAKVAGEVRGDLGEQGRDGLGLGGERWPSVPA